MSYIGNASVAPTVGGVSTASVPRYSGTVANPYQGGGRPNWQGNPSRPGGGMFDAINKPQPAQLTPEEMQLAIACGVGMPQGGGGDGAVAPFSNPTGYNPVSAPTVQQIETRQMPFQMPTTYASVGQSLSPQTPWMPPSLPGFNAGPLGQAKAFNGLGGPQGSGAGSMQGMLSQLLMALRGNVGF